MKTFSQLAAKASPSKFVNAWKVKMGSKRFLLTPAHVAVYKKNGNWLVSKFLKDFYHLDWYIPVNYLAKYAPEDDIAWTQLPDSTNDESFFDLSDETVNYPTNVDFFFRQPYNADGVWVNNSALASIDSVLYPSPESQLLEALDVGFRGMSGAVALKHGTKQVLGLFVGKGTALGLKENAELPEFLKASRKEKAEVQTTVKWSHLKESSVVTAEKTDPSLNLTASNSEIINMTQLFLQELKKVETRLEAKSDHGFEQLNRQMQHLDDKVDYLVRNALMKQDLNNLLNIVALRRGLVISNQSIFNHIERSLHVEIKTFAKLPDEL